MNRRIRDHVESAVVLLCAPQNAGAGDAVPAFLSTPIQWRRVGRVRRRLSDIVNRRGRWRTTGDYNELRETYRLADEENRLRAVGRQAAAPGGF
jgi:hypothetical protein